MSEACFQHGFNSTIVMDAQAAILWCLASPSRVYVISQLLPYLISQSSDGVYRVNHQKICLMADYVPTRVSGASPRIASSFVTPSEFSSMIPRFLSSWAWVGMKIRLQQVFGLSILQR